MNQPIERRAVSTPVCVMFLIYPQTRTRRQHRAVTRLDGNRRTCNLLEYTSTKAAKMRQQNPADIHTPGTCMPSVSPLTNKRQRSHKHARRAPEKEREKKKEKKKGEDGLTSHQKWANMFNHHAKLFSSLTL